MEATGESHTNVQNDLFLDTAGHCFLCLKTVQTSYEDYLCPSFNFDKKVYSFQYPSQYLKIDKSKVFEASSFIPVYLLEKMKTSKLKVELCEDCADVNERFTQLFQQLETIKMELTGCVRIFEEKLKSKDLGLSGESSSSSHLLENIRKAQRLRLETLEKCSRKLQSSALQEDVDNQQTSPPLHSDEEFEEKSENCVKEDPLGLSIESDHCKKEEDACTTVYPSTLSSPSPHSPQEQMETDLQFIEEETRPAKVIKVETINRQSEEHIQRGSVDDFEEEEDPLKEVSLFATSDSYENVAFLRDSCIVSCQFCSRSFLSKNILVRHILEAHTLNQNPKEKKKVSKKSTFVPLLCNLCTKYFDSRTALSLHKRHTHGYKFKIGKNQWKCPTCEEIIFCEEIKQFIEHQETLHALNRNEYEDLSSIKLTPKPTYRKKKNKPSGASLISSEFFCTLCGSCYSERKALKNHKRHTHGYKFRIAPNQYKCPVCLQDFSEMLPFLEHQEKEHPWKGKSEKTKTKKKDDKLVAPLTEEILPHSSPQASLVKAEPLICEDELLKN